MNYKKKKKKIHLQSRINEKIYGIESSYKSALSIPCGKIHVQVYRNVNVMIKKM